MERFSVARRHQVGWLQAQESVAAVGGIWAERTKKHENDGALIVPISRVFWSVKSGITSSNPSRWNKLQKLYWGHVLWFYCLESSCRVFCFCLVCRCLVWFVEGGRKPLRRANKPTKMVPNPTRFTSVRQPFWLTGMRSSVGKWVNMKPQLAHSRKPVTRCQRDTNDRRQTRRRQTISSDPSLAWSVRLG